MDQLFLEESGNSLARLMDSTYFPFTRRDPAPLYDRATPPDLPATQTAVLEMDCVDAAIQLVVGPAGCRRVGILNMANEWNCGGGFERMGGSQEEYLFRRTSIGMSLWPHRMIDDERWRNGCAKLPAPTPDTEYYPLTEAGGVLTPHLEVIGRTGNVDAGDYLPRERRPAAGLDAFVGLTIAAQDLRTERHYNRGARFSFGLTCQKFRTLCHMAVVAGCDAVVFGAIGCGAFRNPPAEICRAFAHVVHGEFAGAFREVVYAVIKSRANLKAFTAAFGRDGVAALAGRAPRKEGDAAATDAAEEASAVPAEEKKFGFGDGEDAW